MFWTQRVFTPQIHNLEEQLEQFREELENKSEEVQQLHMQLEIQRKEISSQQEYLETRDSMLQVNSHNVTRTLTTCCIKPHTFAFLVVVVGILHNFDLESVILKMNH